MAKFPRSVNPFTSICLEPSGKDSTLLTFFVKLPVMSQVMVPVFMGVTVILSSIPLFEIVPALIKVDSAGSYDGSSAIGIIGDPNAKWLGSLITNFSWKALSFGMQWDYVHGGQIFSYTAATMVGRGVSKDLESFDPTLPLIVPGVLEILDGSGSVTGYKPNDIPLTTAGVFFGNTIVGGAPNDRGIYDATRVRFREVSLSYSLPKSFVSKLKLNGLSISAVGNNLWFKAVNAPKYAKADFDRTAFGSSNGAGFDYLGGPSARRYGATVKLTF